MDHLGLYGQTNKHTMFCKQILIINQNMY